MSDPDPVTRLNAALEGRYRIERELGEGGMATVYLADDLKHERKVALKVLKPELAAVVGAERFLAEIKTTANLQHPHILPLFDSGEADTYLFYVMPYVEGETLRDRLGREHQLPVDEAVQIAKNVAEALDYAHSHGVIHRDIKPANILLQAGKPVLSDFGIALAVGVAGGGRLTETGLSLGTPHYMSPEQATGDLSVGATTDVYALGCVLFEMLVGEPPYTGGSAQAVLAKILMDEAPTPTKARASVPANVDAAIGKALEKLPADRFTGAGELARALADSGFRHREAQIPGAAQAAGIWRAMFWAGWASAAVFAALAVWTARRPPPVQPVARFESPLFEGLEARRRFDLSRDGTRLVFSSTGDGDGPGQLWVRHWSERRAGRIPDTEGADSPSFSPSGDQVVFHQQGSVRVASLGGGPVRTVLDRIGASYVHWGADDHLYVTHAFTGQLFRVSAAEGIAEVVDTLSDGRSYRVTEVLPDRDWLLVEGTTTGTSRSDSIFAFNHQTAERVDIAVGEQGQIIDERYLAFVRDNSLMIAPFDPDDLTLTGPAEPIVEDVGRYVVSGTGDLLYVRGFVAEEDPWELVWATRAGDLSPAGWQFDRGGPNVAWKLSPDGRRVALRHVVNGNPDIWVKELPDGAPIRITFDAAPDQIPDWMPDGSRVSYFNRGNLWSASGDGTGNPQLLLDDSRAFRQTSWFPSGDGVVLRVGGASGSPVRDLLVFRVGVDSAAIPLVASPDFAENDPALSPDGRWLAYTTNETGQDEVWIRPFPDFESGKTRVSTDRGFQPEWAHSGSELFYIGGAPPRLMSALIDTTGGVSRVAGRETLFEIPSANGAGSDDFDVAPDDQRFLLARRLGSASEAEARNVLVLVQNFFEELSERVPKLKPQIPWLRVFVEGVVIVGSILLIAGCGGADPANVDEARVLQPDELCSDFSDAAIATFEDANLETLVRQQLSVGPQEDLTCGLISSLALLSGNSGGVASLVGIQNLTGLSDLRLASNSLTDISPLGGLTGLTSLMLLENQISDLTSLSNLTGLTSLFLDENLITDLGALSGLTGITLLHLDQNSITNVTALGALADLNRLRLDDNSSLSDIQPLLDNSGLGAGDTVYLRGTAVSCADVLELEGNGVTVVSDCP